MRSLASHNRSWPLVSLPEITEYLDPYAFEPEEENGQLTDETTLCAIFGHEHASSSRSSPRLDKQMLLRSIESMLEFCRRWFIHGIHGWRFLAFPILTEGHISARSTDIGLQTGDKLVSVRRALSTDRRK